MKTVFTSRLPPDGAECESLALSDPMLTVLPPLRVTGLLEMRGMKRLATMHSGEWQMLCLQGCPNLSMLPAMTRPLKKLMLDGCGVEQLPADLHFEDDAVLILQNCHRLRRLPDIVSSGRLREIFLCNCPRLEALPELSARWRIAFHRMPFQILDTSLTAPWVTVSCCRQLRAVHSHIVAERVYFGGCTALEEVAVPEGALSYLSFRNCHSLAALPDGLRFSGDSAQLDLAGCSRLTTLPDTLSAAPVHPQAPALIVSADGCPLKHAPAYPFPWMIEIRGVRMEPAALLDPQGIDPATVLRHPNAEVRRVLLENLGMAPLLARTEHALIDEDTDPGGRRRLLHFRLPVPPPRPRGRVVRPASTSVSERAGRGVGRFLAGLLEKLFAPAPSPSRPPSPPPPPGMEALRCRHLECHCPSTGRLYLLPVPPALITCRAAAAWLAGFDDPNDYAPVQET